MLKQITGVLGLIGLVLGLIAYTLYKKDIKNNITIDKLSNNMIVLTHDLEKCHELKDNQVGGCFDYIEGKNKLEGKYSDLIVEYNKAVSKLEGNKHAGQDEVVFGDKPVHSEDDNDVVVGGRVAAAKRLLCAANLAEEQLCKST